MVEVGCGHVWDGWRIRMRVLTWLAPAHGERVALVAGLAHAHRRMIDHRADGGDAARSGARIGAALVHARLVRQALGAERALGPTVGRPADVVRQARAGGQLVDGAAQRVRAARRWLARIDGVLEDGCFYGGLGWWWGGDAGCGRGAWGDGRVASGSRHAYYTDRQ